MSVKIHPVRVVIPFRLRADADPRRAANLEVVQAWWYAHGYEPLIQTDGLEGDQQFNRHRAYNLAVSGNPKTHTFVFAEADMLIHPGQIRQAVRLARRQPGLVVPFYRYHYLSDSTTALIRDEYHDMDSKDLAEWWAMSTLNPFSVFQFNPESVMDNGRSIGAVTVVSRETLDITGGFTESTSGNWYDDNITEEGFAFLTGTPTRFIPGPAVHMYHLPGHKGDHLSHADKIATESNKHILLRMRRDIRMNRADRVYNLMSVRRPAEVTTGKEL